MAKYQVRVFYSSFVDVEVEAEYDWEASEKAEILEPDMDEIQKNLYIRECDTEVWGGSREVKVDWDADDESDPGDLPEVASVPADIPDEGVADWISDNYGFCVNSWMEV